MCILERRRVSFVSNPLLPDDDPIISHAFVIRSLGEPSNLYMTIDLLYMNGQSLLMDLMYTPFPYRCVEMFFRQGLKIFVTRS